MRDEHRWSSWIRNNILGLVAIFIALSGSAFAANVASTGKATPSKKSKPKRGPRGPAGLQGNPGVAGAPGTARAYAAVSPSNCDGPPPGTCAAAVSKGVESVTHPLVGFYCVKATGIDPLTTVPAVSVDSGGTTAVQDNTTVQWNRFSPNCPANTFQVVTSRYPNGGGSFNFVYSDSVAFGIVIP
jgi:hypothetical protein